MTIRLKHKDDGAGAVLDFDAPPVVEVACGVARGPCGEMVDDFIEAGDDAASLLAKAGDAMNLIQAALAMTSLLPLDTNDPAQRERIGEKWSLAAYGLEGVADGIAALREELVRREAISKRAVTWGSVLQL